jgi:hypothetical protein
MREYTVIWHYIANYGTIQLQAQDPVDAMEKAVGHFSDDFKQKANVFVFNGVAAIAQISADPKYAEKVSVRM